MRTLITSTIILMALVPIPSCGVDSDGDGQPDFTDLCPNDPNKTDPGVCGCNIPEGDCTTIPDTDGGTNSDSGIEADGGVDGSTNAEQDSASESTTETPNITEDYTTPYDGGIIGPERRRFKLIIFKGGTSAAQRNWDKSDNTLWSMNLRDAKGVAASDMNTYNNLWRGDSSINDAKRVIHNNKIHIAVCGNAGNAVAMYEFETKKCIYWSHTTASSPHDVEYVPVGGGYLVVANSANNAVLEVYDISKNNKGRSSSVEHSGCHSVHWDAKQKLLWAWGSGQSGLKSYKLIVQNGKPILKMQNEYKVTVPDFNVGMAHGGSPMLVDGKRYLILAGKSGILRFDTEAHTWNLIKRAPGDSGLYSNPKGLSYNRETGEIILTKSKDSVWSLEDGVGTRQLDNSEFYKARWWYHSSFSHAE